MEVSQSTLMPQPEITPPSIESLPQPPIEQPLPLETQTPQQDQHPGFFRIFGNKISSYLNRNKQPDPVIETMNNTPMSRRNFLKGVAAVGIGAVGAAVEQKVVQAAPFIPEINPAVNPNSENATAESVSSLENTVAELRERTHDADPGTVLSSQEKAEQDDEVINRIFEGIQEMLNKKGLLTTLQVDESKLYPSYYLDNGGKVTGRNKGEFAQDSTLKWSRDYRPISTWGLKFNLPNARIPETLKNIVPENPRSQENWREIVKQFGLDNPENLRYQPDEYTYCNFAARDMLRAFGVGDIPQWFKDFSTGEIRETVTNIMFQQIKQYGTFNLEKYQQEGENARDWIKVDKKGAIEQAKEGKPVVLLVGRSTGVGHMAILNPDSTAEKLVVAQAGSKVGSAVEWDESHYSTENNYTETLFLVHKLDFENPSIG